MGRRPDLSGSGISPFCLVGGATPVKTPPTFVLNPGVQVSTRFDMTRAHLFDGVTQRALT
jgi:hypothetical protein